MINLLASPEFDANHKNELKQCSAMYDRGLFSSNSLVLSGARIVSVGDRYGGKYAGSPAVPGGGSKEAGCHYRCHRSGAR